MPVPKPIRKNVIVCRLKEDKETESGLILTGSVDATLPKFIVESVGDEVTLVKVNEIVYCDIQKIKSCPYDNMDTWIVSEDDILGVVDS